MAFCVQLVVVTCLTITVVQVNGGLRTCGDTGLSCIRRRSYCNGEMCVCKGRYPRGNPYFNCYREGDFVGEVKMDPILTNVQERHAQFPYSCRFLVNHFKIWPRGSKRKGIKMCEFVIHSYIAKNKGKFLVHGVDVAVTVNFAATSRVVKRSARIYGVQRNGVDEVTITASHDFEPEGPTGGGRINQFRSRFNNARMKIKQRRKEHRYLIVAQGCGVVATFTPYDIELGQDGPIMAGVSFVIDRRNNPQWLSTDSSMTLTPNLSWEDIQVGNLGRRSSALVRAFRSGVAQTQPIECSECTRAHTIYSSCSDVQLEAASPACDWMLDEPRFIKCIDKDIAAQLIGKLHNDCVESFCGGPSTCADVISDITAAGCNMLPDPPASLTDFLSGALCP